MRGARFVFLVYLLRTIYRNIMLHTLLLLCGTYAYLFPSDEGSCYVFQKIPGKIWFKIQTMHEIDLFCKFNYKFSNFKIF